MTDTAIVGESATIHDITATIAAVASNDVSVLIEGESGTGKELVARALHMQSARNKQPFVALNCAALTETLLDSELFGFVKGAFTGAYSMQRGVLEMAHHGTLFLDEIGDMSLSAQLRLLRTLQEGEVCRVGSHEPIKIDVRVIAATNRNLEQAVEAGTFRRDLFYRLDVITLKLPPLRERTGDVPLLAHHLLKKHATRLQKNVTGISEQAMTALLLYSWPGNVRELENAVQHAVVLAKGAELALDDLPLRLRHRQAVRRTMPEPELPFVPMSEARRRIVAEFERGYLHRLMDHCHGNISRAAQIAGCDRSNFRRRLREYGIQAQLEPFDVKSADEAQSRVH